MALIPIRSFRIAGWLARSIDNDDGFDLDLTIVTVKDNRIVVANVTGSLIRWADRGEPITSYWMLVDGNAWL